MTQVRKQKPSPLCNLHYRLTLSSAVNFYLLTGVVSSNEVRFYSNIADSTDVTEVSFVIILSLEKSELLAKYSSPRARFLLGEGDSTYSSSKTIWWSKLS